MTEINVTNSVDFIDEKIMQDMIKRVNNFAKKNKKSPTKVYLNPNAKPLKFVSFKKYEDMKKRYDAWIKSNNKPPAIIYINKPTQLENDLRTNFAKLFDDAIGLIPKTWKDVCKGIFNRKYLYYYNDRYAQSVAVKRVKNKTGLNCTDICQIVKQRLLELGYEVQFYHIMCKSGGHIQIRVRGKELGNKWKIIDPAASLNGTDCEKLWCQGTSTVISSNQTAKWIMIDDGI